MSTTKVNLDGINELDLALAGTVTATTTAGVTTVTQTGVTALTLETNGTPNGSQTLLNLKNGTGITITDDGVGGVTVTGSASGVTSVAANSPLASSGGTTPTISANLPGGIGVSIYGAAVPNTGLLGFVQIPFNCTINSWTILMNATGSAQFDVQTSTYAGFPTTSSIVASLPPVVTAAQSATSSTLTGWSTTITAGTVVAFYLTSVSTATIISMTLKVTRT
jgi:hypothetical protein